MQLRAWRLGGGYTVVFEVTIKHWGRFRGIVCWVGLGDRVTVGVDEEHLHVIISQMPLVSH